jgi:hypothetical protein
MKLIKLLNEISINEPFSFFKVLNAYKNNSLYNESILNNGYILFHLYLRDDFLKVVYGEDEEKIQKSKDYLDNLNKELGTSYILFKGSSPVKSIRIGEGGYADVLNRRFIRDRRKDYSEAILDSEQNFKELIKGDPNRNLETLSENCILITVNGLKCIYSLNSLKILGEFDSLQPNKMYWLDNEYIVKKDRKTFIIKITDDKIEKINEDEYDDHNDYEDYGGESKYLVYKDGFTYKLDNHRKPMFKIKGIYKTIHPGLNPNQFIVSNKETQQGVVDDNGKEIIPFSNLFTRRISNSKYIVSGKDSFSIFDDKGNIVKQYNVKEPQIANIRNFNQLGKILKVIPTSELKPLFTLSDWSQIYAYSKDPIKTVEMTNSGDVISKFDDELIKDCLKRAPGEKKKQLLKIFKTYNKSPMLDKYYKKYNIQEIKNKLKK